MAFAIGWLGQADDGIGKPALPRVSQSPLYAEWMISSGKAYSKIPKWTKQSLMTVTDLGEPSMFGFIRPSHKDIRSATPAATQFPAGILVSKQDIYLENKGMEPILLLRKGYEVTPEELPRYIRNGVQPHHFQLKHAPDSQLLSLPIPTDNPPIRPVRGHQPPISKTRTPQPQSQRNALILSSEPKSLKRLIDCVFMCGISLDKIHPLRVINHLSWAMDKYHPEILIAEYPIADAYSGLEALIDVRERSSLKQVIIILDAPSHSNTTLARLRKIAMANDIEILTKPISRVALHRILSS